MPKSSQEKAEVRRQAEANRRGDKDRSAHERGRGKAKTTLSSLSRELPTEDQLVGFIDILAQEPSDRSAAIMAAGLVEQALYVAICSRLADPGDAIRDTWFNGDNSPFGTFAAKIKLDRALAIYADKMEAKLNVIKNVRNVFAHRSTPIDFSHDLLAEEASKLKTRIAQKGGKMAFCAACLAVARLLIKDAFDKGGAEMEISFP